MIEVPIPAAILGAQNRVELELPDARYRGDEGVPGLLVRDVVIEPMAVP
ncbi:MAG: hypothetical protein U0166_03680 [Acidobacteriota bacterium]